MINFTKDQLKEFLLREDGEIKKNNFILNEEIFNNLYDEISKEDEQSPTEFEFEDFYQCDLIEKCTHDDYDVITESYFEHGLHEFPDEREVKYAKCKYCGKLGRQIENDNEIYYIFQRG